MPRRFVVPYKAGSASARALSDALGGKRIRLRNSRHRAQPQRDDMYINWGNTAPPDVVPRERLLNLPEAVARASNKLSFFELHHPLGVLPDYWTNAEEIPDDAFPIVCRTLLNASGGRGIVIADTRADLVAAPLYVRYVKKADEFRVHLGYVEGEESIIAVQQKRRRHDHADPNWQIRNHANGFIYAREGVRAPQCVLDAAKMVFKDSELDFGAVDVIYNAKADAAYVLEINTAPGLEGQTLQDYVNHFQQEEA